MDALKEIREEARRRYEKERKEKEEKEREKEREKEIELERENAKEKDHSYIYDQFDEWDKLSQSVDVDRIVTLHLFYSILDDRFMKLLKQYDRLDELQDRVIKLVHNLNELSAVQNGSNGSNLHEIREMANVMQMIIHLSEVDIPIEMMDTTNDEELSKNLHYQLNQYIDEKDEKEDIIHQEAVEILPTVSLSSTRVGLRLPAMRAIAKANGILLSGTKKELAMRLAANGLIQLI